MDPVQAASIQIALLVLVLVLAFVVGTLVSLVKFLSGKIVDMSETRHIESAIDKRRNGNRPAVFQEPDEDQEYERREPSRPLWTKAPPGTTVGQ